MILRQNNNKTVKLIKITSDNYVIMLKYSKIYYTNLTVALEQFEKLQYRY